MLPLEIKFSRKVVKVNNLFEGWQELETDAYKVFILITIAVALSAGFIQGAPFSDMNPGNGIGFAAIIIVGMYFLFDFLKPKKPVENSPVAG